MKKIKLNGYNFPRDKGKLTKEEEKIKLKYLKILNSFSLNELKILGNIATSIGFENEFKKLSKIFNEKINEIDEVEELKNINFYFADLKYLPNVIKYIGKNNLKKLIDLEEGKYYIEKEYSILDNKKIFKAIFKQKSLFDDIKVIYNLADYSSFMPKEIRNAYDKSIDNFQIRIVPMYINKLKSKLREALNRSNAIARILVDYIPVCFANNLNIENVTKAIKYLEEGNIEEVKKHLIKEDIFLNKNNVNNDIKLSKEFNRVLKM